MAVSRATRGVLQKCLLKNYIKFTRKHLCRSLFLNKVADVRTATLLKKFYFCEFCKIFKNIFLYSFEIMFLYLQSKSN